ncbi:hypothetical protein G9A89_002139 [Geosiphon pyriformis]|nr:hypothetical protein G9A89_002139 [Geosiphon pyriformis]
MREILSETAHNQAFRDRNNKMTDIKWDQDVVKVIKKWIEDNNETAKRIFNLLRLQSNSSECASLLGFFYHYGIGEEYDETKAFKWYKKSADENDAFALAQVGYCYSTGTGTECNDLKTFEYYEKAANLGDPQGAYHFARFNLSYKSLIWYQKSAEKGFLPAKLKIIGFFHTGTGGVLRDRHMAFRLMRQGYRE